MIFVCLNPVCDAKAKHKGRGLCYPCYDAKRDMVNRGRDVWESQRYRQPGRLGRPTAQCSTFGCQNLANKWDDDGKPEYVRINQDSDPVCLECYNRAKPKPVGPEPKLEPAQAREPSQEDLGMNIEDKDD